ncbi:MAG: ribonuclease H-like domain-containing protein [Sandaracinaceae bacterium]|nr:ribonuclease H-like domain-containing protein [Sandaracinaceae bacterium]
MALDLKKKLARLGSPQAPASGAGAPRTALGGALDVPHSDEPARALQSLEPPHSSPHDAKQERISMLRELIAKKHAEMEKRRLERLAAAPPPEPLPGVLEETPSGPLHRVARYLEPAHCHGRTPIAGALTVSSKSLAALALDDSLADLDLRRVLFLDTETTGLSGGTGTLPFLVGLAWFEDESLCLEQLLLRKPGEERPMLERLAMRMANASALCTYNGKSFDWPLLRTRAVMNRVPVPAPTAHLDLLHCARRVFGPRLKEVRLVQMEAEVLGLRREHDIDGAEIPMRFWDFVRGADGSRLTPVIEHNANDLVALAALVVALAERWDGVLPHHAPEDRLAVAKVAYRYGDHPRALERARDAADAGGAAHVTAQALVLGAQAARKTDDRRVEEAMWLEALEHAQGSERARVHLALAKLYEHELHDFDRALDHLSKAEEAEDASAIAKRKARLEKKRARASLPPVPKKRRAPRKPRPAPATPGETDAAAVDARSTSSMS